jgi:hypothetical protein
MGTLYREIVEPRYHKMMKFIQLCMIAIVTLDIVFLLSSFKELIIKELTYFGYAFFPIAIFMISYLWVKSKVKYRYVIIDNELIIERFYGDKRKVVLNINVKHIVRIEKASCSAKFENISKNYKFTCLGSKKNSFRCIYNKDGKLYSFCFEPSLSLINKIEMIRPLI